MKRLLLTITILAATATAAHALSYDESRQRAWYLTDKMAYELDLTGEQYDRVYEINLNYFLNINYASDIDGVYLRYRDQDLRYVLFSSQYDRYISLSYLYRPLVWRSGMCIMLTYDYYARGFYYYDRPAIYNVYRGVSWVHRRGPSPYSRMTFRADVGMRQRYGHGYLYRDGIRYDAPPRRNMEGYGRRDVMRGSSRFGSRGNYGQRPQNQNYSQQGQDLYNSGNNHGGAVRNGGTNYRDKIEGQSASTTPSENTQRVPQGNSTAPRRSENQGSFTQKIRENARSKSSIGGYSRAAIGTTTRPISSEVQQNSSSSRSGIMRSSSSSSSSRATGSGTIRSSSPSGRYRGGSATSTQSAPRTSAPSRGSIATKQASPSAPSTATTRTRSFGK